MRGEWVRKPKSGASVVFVHGILSSGETCWRHDNGSYWPELLKSEPGLEAWGIYVYTYATGIFSGTYSLNDVVDDLKERLFTFDKVAENRRIVFVCHSMGGIAVRKFLVERVNDFIDRNIEVGLFLVASPSLGASYANWLKPLARLAGHAQADILRFSQSNTWLSGLDKEFQNIKESGRLRMYGKELLEDKFIVFRKLLRKQVVEPFAGARYFGEPYKVPGSDHFSIAKPADAEAIQHRLLVVFLEKLSDGTGNKTELNSSVQTSSNSVEKHQQKVNYKVFISSTYLDNHDRRKLVEDAVLRAEMTPVGMERFTATTNPTVNECERHAQECDLYLGIIAHRYGWIPDGKIISITEMEYEAAKQAGRPRLVFEIDTSIPVFPDRDYDPLPERWSKQGKLDAFKAKYRQDQMPGLFKETTLSGMVLQALYRYRDEKEGKTSDPIISPLSTVADDELSLYRAAAESLHKSLPLAGFKTKLRVPIDLEQLYVPLHAVVDLRGSGDSRFADAEDALEKVKSHNSQDIPLVEAFREAEKRKRRGIVILGDPGSGKTTHLKRLLLACFQEGPSNLGLSANLLPVFLPLRELDDLSSGIDAFIEKTLASPHLKMPTGFGERLLARGHLLLLFDGLDEINDPEQRAKVSRWIEKAVQLRSDCVAVITCRFAGYDEKAQLDSQFLELHLRPLSKEQAEEFIRHWYHAVETGLASDPAQGQINADKRAGVLIERLEAPDFRSARMATMTRNPLLLANLCLVHRDRGALPRGRHQLYDECIEVLLERWREGKDLTINVSAETGRRVLQPAALWLHQEGGRTRASAKELAPVLEPVVKSRQWPGGDAYAFLRTVRDESGLLTGWGHDQYGFMHLGFQEYLSACELRRLAFEGDKSQVMKDLASHYSESWWQEVILLLLAQGNPSLFEPFMKEALQNPQFEGTMDLFNLILEEAAEVTPTPFLELVRQSPGKDPAHRARQITALKVLERLLPEPELKDLAESLRGPFVFEHAFCRIEGQATMRTGQITRITENGGVELVQIPGGRFRMGSPKGQGDEYENPQHEVEITSFFLGRNPVTNDEYARFLKANPKIDEPIFWGDRQFNQMRQPVVGVSWEDARRFAEWAGARLPSEAEWEYACRAGTTTAYWWGDDIGSNRANGVDSGSQWSGKHTSPVGSFEPNSLGVYDTSGNVWEWCEDLWHDNYQGAPMDGSAWVDSKSGRRVIRGGSWDNGPAYLRSAIRFGYYPDDRNDDLGFRLAQD